MAPNLTLPNMLLVGELPLDLTRRRLEFRSKKNRSPVDQETWVGSSLTTPATSNEGSDESAGDFMELSPSKERVDTIAGERHGCQSHFPNYQRGARKLCCHGDLQPHKWRSGKVEDMASRLERRKVAVARKWLSENLPDIKRTALALYSLLAAYSSFCKENGEQPISELPFLNMLRTEFPVKQKEERVQRKKLCHPEGPVNPKAAFLKEQEGSTESLKATVLFDAKEHEPIVPSDEKEQKPVYFGGEPIGTKQNDDQEKVSIALEDSFDSGSEEMECVDHLTSPNDRGSNGQNGLEKRQTLTSNLTFSKCSSMESDAGSYDSGFDSYEYDSDKQSSESDSESHRAYVKPVENQELKLSSERLETNPQQSAYSADDEELGSLVIDEASQQEEDEEDKKPITIKAESNQKEDEEDKKPITIKAESNQKEDEEDKKPISIKVESNQKEVRQCDSSVSDSSVSGSSDSRNVATDRVWNESQRRAISHVIALLELKEFSESPCFSDAKKLSQIFVQMLSTNHLGVFLQTFGHSMSCRVKQCSKLCFMFKRIFKHLTSSVSHKCAVKQIYGHVLRLHVDTCKVDRCGFSNCRILKRKRIAASGGLEHPSPIAI